MIPPFFAVLCADRVGQMTKTYSDIDAVTRLLEEVGFMLSHMTCRELFYFFCSVLSLGHEAEEEEPKIE